MQNIKNTITILEVPDTDWMQYLDVVEDTRCPRCEGAGRVGGRPCPVCKGRGETSKERPSGYVRCPVCKGSGAVSIPAPEFVRGEGWGEQAKTRYDLCWGTGVVPKLQVLIGGEGEVQFVLGWWDCEC